MGLHGRFSRWGRVGIQASVTVRAHSRGAFSFSFGGLRLCIFFLLEEVREQKAVTKLGSSWPHPTCTHHFPLSTGLIERLTEALLEPDSSSALGGWVAFFRLRGLDRAAFRRLLGGLVEESSYSSAREKRSLNLRDRTGFLREVSCPGPSHLGT